MLRCSSRLLTVQTESLTANSSASTEDQTMGLGVAEFGLSASPVFASTKVIGDDYL